MFLNYYGFREQPFGFTPDPRFLFGSESCREAHASLLYAIENNVGFSALIAEPGMGKTTLLFDLLERLRETARTGFLFTTQDSSRDLLRYINLEFELPDCEGDSVRFHEQFKDFLLAEARGNRPVILLVDEAQNLDDQSLEAIRLLSDFEMPGKKLLHVLLAGQPQFAEKLSQQSLSQFFQRVATVTRLVKFTPEETTAYIEHHLRTAGYRGAPLFTSEALARIAEASDGIPRQINRICFNALSIACALRRRTVSVEVITEVESDLDLGTISTSSSPAGQKSVRESRRPQADREVNVVGDLESLRNERSQFHSMPESWNTGPVVPMQSRELLQESPLWKESAAVGHDATHKPANATRTADSTVERIPLTTTPALRSQTSKSTPRSMMLRIIIAALVIVELVIAVLLIVRHAPTTARAGSGSAQKTASHTGPLNPRSSQAGSSVPNPQFRTFRPATGRDFKVVDLPFVSRPSNRRPRPAMRQPVTTPPITLSVRRSSIPGAAQKPIAVPQNEAPPAIPLVSSQSPKTPQLASFHANTPALSQLTLSRGQVTGGTPITVVRPRFPENTGAKQAEDTVVLDLTVDESGNVRDVHVVSGSGEFVAAAIQAVRNWKYQPYAVDGQAVEMSTRVTLNFRRTE